MNLKLLMLSMLVVLVACSDEPKVTTDAVATDESAAPAAPPRFGGSQLEMPDDVLVANPSSNANRQAFFGDLHVHTTYSFDAFAFGTMATPYDAYRYAKGESIKHPAGFDVQLREPLDFYAVTDHAMFIGALRAAADTTTEFSKFEHVQDLHNLNAPENLTLDSRARRSRAFSNFLGPTLAGIADGTIDVEMVNDIARDAWSDIIKAAEEFNDPGKFTTFVAYEYTTSSDDRGNLHRNVIFRAADKLPAMPFSRFHSQDPEGLWDWMDNLRDQGIETLAIPHNSNGSNGQMFKLVDWANNPMDENYTQKRIRNEPLIEITQIKGTSETHPALSPNDEWSGFEIMPYRIATTWESDPKGSYAREALLNGLSFRDAGISNPYKFGFIGSSDTHTGAISDDEANYFMKIGILDATPEFRGSVPLKGEDEVSARDTMNDAEQTTGANPPRFKDIEEELFADGAPITWGASGLAAVWAEENSRSAIYDAFRRKETFATSGTRIKVRLFGGYGFDKTMLDDKKMVQQAYAEGVAMGSDLVAQQDAPSFLVQASQDPLSAPLQRLQIIKGWTDNDKHFEQVFDVACADGTVNSETHRCSDNGATVDLATCAISDGSGTAELKTVWEDPDFNPKQNAFYYARVLENPTCRWSTWDALRAGTTPRSDYPATIQERAWTSPIWMVPVL